MSQDPPPADDVYASFVRELAGSPQASDMLAKLRLGHDPDENGWCSHSAHAHRWERHPCFARRLADLAGRTQVPDGADVAAELPEPGPGQGGPEPAG